MTPPLPTRRVPPPTTTTTEDEYYAIDYTPIPTRSYPKPSTPEKQDEKPALHLPADDSSDPVGVLHPVPHDDVGSGGREEGDARVDDPLTSPLICLCPSSPIARTSRVVSIVEKKRNRGTHLVPCLPDASHPVQSLAHRIDHIQPHPVHRRSKDVVT